MLPVLLSIGVITGLLLGLLGIGGGLFLFPIMLHYQFTIPQIVAISLFLNAVPNTLPGFYLYYRNGHFDLRVGLVVSFGILIGSLIGSYIGSLEYLSKQVLYRIYTFILCLTVVYMAYYHC
jgi:uncharacterized protein